MSDNGQPEQRGWNRLILWFLTSVVIPLLPLPVIRVVDYYLGFPGHGLRDETILIYAFLLPFLYLEKIQQPIAKIVLALSSMAGLLLFVIAHVLEHKELNSNPGAADPVHKAGAFLCFCYIVLATSFEAYKSFKKADRSV